jgi:periplasmic copper chaperone A
MFTKHLIAGLCITLSTLAQAEKFQAPSIHIGHPYAHATAPGQPVGGAYLTLTNRGPFDRLIQASTPAAASTELHSMSMQGDVMRMREVDAIALPKDQAVILKPGGTHIMLMGLKAPLPLGSKIPLTLSFERAGKRVVMLDVEAIKPHKITP